MRVRPARCVRHHDVHDALYMAQQLGDVTLALHAQVETLMLESQQLRRGVMALVRAASDKEVAASPALQALRDQVIGLEHVRVLAE